MRNSLPSEPPIAICYLGKETDKRNQLLLTENFLAVVRKGKITSFEAGEVLSLAIESRKMMLPLIAGGVFSSLSAVAMAENLFDPWSILIWFMLNLGLLYYGWLGYNVLCVQLKGTFQDFPIKKKGKNLNAFIAFANEYFSSKSTGGINISSIYHIASRKDWEANANNDYAPSSLSSEGFIHFATKEQLPLVVKRHFKHQSDLVLIEVNPLKLSAALKYEMAYEQENLYPHLYGALNPEAVVAVSALNK